MQEYPAYTVNKIEEELTYELLYLFVRTAAERRQQRTKKKSNVTDIDIEDLAEGRASLQGFGVEKVVKH